MAVCASLITGATYALFTSESTTNIAITSGKVSVQAAADLITGFSAKYEGSDYVKETRNPDGEGLVTFTNGGTAKYDSTKNTLTVSKISPGDGVTFNLTAENSSNIAIKYQTVVTFVSGGKTTDDTVSEDTDIALFHALNISVGDDENMQNVSSDRSTAVSGWTNIGPNADIDPISVTIELPVEAGDEFQEMSCMLTIGLYAVQANGNDTTNQDTGFTYFVGEGSNLSDVFGEVQSGDTVALNGNVNQSEEEAALEVKDGKNVTFDLNGHNFGVAADTSKDNGLMIGEGSELTLKNEANTEGETLPKFTVDTQTYHSGNGNDPDANFTLRVDGQLNVEGVEFHIEGKSGETAALVSGDDASITFDDSAKLTMTGKGRNVEYGNGFSDGIIVSSGADVTLNGTTVKTDGAITPFIVGFQNDAETTSSLNLNGADVTFDNMYNGVDGYQITNVAGLQAYTGGEINIDKSTIKVCGSTGGYGTLSNAVALSCVGGGEITFKDSTMELSVSDGCAIAAEAVTNYSYTGEVATGVYLDAHIKFVSGTITGNTEEGGSITLFAAQRNGTQQYKNPGDYIPVLDSKTLELKEGDLCSIIISDGVTITVNGDEVDASNGNAFYKDTTRYDELTEYMLTAIQDNRTQP